MRMDKLTTKFQEALAEAQSLALGRDHQLLNFGRRLSLEESERIGERLRRRPKVNEAINDTGRNSCTTPTPKIHACRA